MNQQLQDYITQSRQVGKTDEQLRQELLNAGWPEDVVSEHMAPQAGQTVTVAPRKIGKFKASKLIVYSSWNILKQDKEMLLFPVLSIISTLVMLILAFIVGYFVLGVNLLNESDIENQTGLVPNVFAFVVYLILFFIGIFFQSGIVSIANGRLNGQNLTFGDGMKNAMRHVGKIFLWSLLASTVGLVLRMIAERFKLVGSIVAWMLGAAWSILSFFILPILIIEDLSIKDSLKKSAYTIRKTWGEVLIVNIGVGLYFMLIAIIGIGVFFGSLVAISTLMPNATWFFIIPFVLFALFLIILTLISSTLDVIFKVLLYQYANTGIVPIGLPPEVLQYAFKIKKK